MTIKTGLALSGGGALGAAHIGVIEELEKAGIRIDFVCGSSAGALIGLAYAIDGLASLDAIFSEIARSNLFLKQEYLLTAWPARALERVESVFGKYLKRRDYETLKIPFACVATDLATGEKKVFDSGDPVRNVLASSSYPGLFSVQKIGGGSYVDGAVTRNLPAEETRAMGADFVIGSSIYSLEVFGEKKIARINRVELLMRAIDIYEHELSLYQEQQCDFCFRPEVRPFRWFNFSKIDEIRRIGREYAKEQIGALKRRLDEHGRA